MFFSLRSPKSAMRQEICLLLLVHLRQPLKEQPVAAQSAQDSLQAEEEER